MEQNINPTDLIAAQLLKAQPDASILTIGKQLTQLGILSNPISVYSNFKNSDYLKRELAQVKQHHNEYLSRKIVPLALKIMYSTLRSKTADPQDRRFYTKLALDKEMREDMPTVLGTKLTINQIQSMQVLIQGKGKEGDE